MKNDSTVIFLLCVLFQILVCVVHTAVCHRNNPAVFDHYDDGFYGEKVTLASLHKQRSHYHGEEEELQRVRNNFPYESMLLKKKPSIHLFLFVPHKTHL